MANPERKRGGGALHPSLPLGVRREPWERRRPLAILHPDTPAESAGLPAPFSPRSCMTHMLRALLLAVAAGLTMTLFAPADAAPLQRKGKGKAKGPPVPA